MNGRFCISSLGIQHFSFVSYYFYFIFFVLNWFRLFRDFAYLFPFYFSSFFFCIIAAAIVDIVVVNIIGRILVIVVILSLTHFIYYYYWYIVCLLEPAGLRFLRPFLTLDFCCRLSVCVFMCLCILVVSVYKPNERLSRRDRRELIYNFTRKSYTILSAPHSNAYVCSFDKFIFVVVFVWPCMVGGIRATHLYCAVNVQRNENRRRRMGALNSFNVTM